MIWVVREILYQGLPLEEGGDGMAWNSLVFILEEDNSCKLVQDPARCYKVSPGLFN
jgi:hypothetical protein